MRSLHERKGEWWRKDILSTFSSNPVSLAGWIVSWNSNLHISQDSIFAIRSFSFLVYCNHFHIKNSTSIPVSSRHSLELYLDETFYIVAFKKWALE